MHRYRASRRLAVVLATSMTLLGLAVSVRPAAGDDVVLDEAPVAECVETVGAEAAVDVEAPVADNCEPAVTEPDAPAVAPTPAPAPEPEPVAEPQPAPVMVEVDEPAAAAGDIVPAQLSNPVPITDYANYPDNIPGIFEPTCAVRDGHILNGLLFTDDDESSDRFRNITVHNSEVVTMTWTSFAAGCEKTLISFSVKRADNPFFDPKENQELDVGSWQYCGSVEKPCVASNGVYSLSITMPPPERACSWQADATIGPPLEVIGPNGTFYSPDVRGPEGKPFPTGAEMLIRAPGGGHDEAANNDGRDPATCAGRVPAAELACAAGGFNISISNSGDIESEFDVTVDGGAPQHFAVAPLESATIPVTAAEDSTHHVLITAETGIDPITITTLRDEDYLVNCEEVPPPPPPPPPTLSLTASPDCDSDAPYLNYAAAAENAAPATVTLRWFDASNVERLTQADVPLTGRVPYPGVVLDANGTPTDWPGWVKQADGRWVEGADGFEWVKPTISLTASFNPTSEAAVVTFPEGNPDCHPVNPPVGVLPRQGLPRTGAESGNVTELGLGLVGLGSIFVLMSRRQRKLRPAWRHLAR